MEKETRMSKYKSLRDELKDDVMNNPSSQFESAEDDDDFLSFIKTEPKKEDTVFNDTMVTPVDVDASSKNEVDALMHKEGNHNTRLDILSKIREEASQIEEEEVVEEATAGSLLDKLAQISPKEDVEALEAYKKEIEVEERKQNQETKKFLKENKQKEKDEKKALKAQIKAEKKALKASKKLAKVNFDDDDVDDANMSDKIINYITIGLAVIAIVLFVLVIKSFIF